MKFFEQNNYESKGYKKVICFILVLTMILSSCASVFAVEAEQPAQEPTEISESAPAEITESVEEEKEQPEAAPSLDEENQQPAEEPAELEEITEESEVVEEQPEEEEVIEEDINEAEVAEVIEDIAEEPKEEPEVVEEIAEEPKEEPAEEELDELEVEEELEEKVEADAAKELPIVGDSWSAYSIEIITKPAVQFCYNDKFSVDGLEIKYTEQSNKGAFRSSSIKYSDAKKSFSFKIDNDDIKVNDTLQSIGQKTITVKYSNQTDAYQITVSKANQTAPTPKLSSKTHNSVTLNTAKAGQGDTKYGYNTSNSTSGATWLDTNAITGLNAETTYYFFIKYTGNTNYNEAYSASLEVTTDKAPATITEINTVNLSIEAPQIDATPTTVAVVLGDNQHFTAGTVAWDPNDATFTTGKEYKATVTLTPDTNYVFSNAAVTVNSSNANVTSNKSSDNLVVAITFAALTAPKKTLTNEDFTFVATNKAFDGNAAEVSIVGNKDGIGNITTTHYYLSNGTPIGTVSPTKAGIYRIAIDVAEGTSYTAISTLSCAAWKYEITKASINSASVTVATPKKGDDITSTATPGNSTYTVESVAWTEDGASITSGKYKNKSTYAVTVTIKPDDNHVFTSPCSVVINTINATATNNAVGTVDAHVTFNQATVTKIDVVSQGALKTSYTAGESFDPTNLWIQMTYSDSTTEVALYSTISGQIEYAPSGALNAANTSVVITYAATHATSVNINVSRKDLSGFAVKMDDYTYAGTFTAPAVENAGDGTVITYYYNTINDYNGTEWTSKTNTSLTAGAYYLYAEVAQSDTYNASQTAIVSFTVAKADQEAGQITASSKTKNTITISALTGKGDTKYGYNTTNAEPASYQDSNVFTGLTANTTYYFFAKFTGNDNYNPLTFGGVGITTLDKDTITPTVSFGNYSYAAIVDNIPNMSVAGIDGGETVGYYFNTQNQNYGGESFSKTVAQTLTPGTYYIYAVVDENANHKLATTAAVAFRVDKAMQTAPTFSAVSAVGSDVIIMPTIAAGAGKTLYGYSSSQSTVPTQWQEAVMLEVEQSNSYYYVFIKYAGNDYYEPAVSEGFKVHTTNANCGAWTLSVSGSAIVGIKDHNGKKFVVTLSGPGYITYGDPYGQGQECATYTAVLPTGWHNEVTFPSIFYSGVECDGTTYEWKSIAPTQAGIYNARIELVGKNTTTAYLRYEITKASVLSPSTLKHSDETIKGKCDGKITNAASTMEYRFGNGEYVKVVGTEIDGLTPGAYYVRYYGDKNHFDSPDTEIVIQTGAAIKVTFDTQRKGITVETQEYSYNQAATKPSPDPQCDEAQFDGWFKDGQPYVFGTLLTTNVALRAHWTVYETEPEVETEVPNEFDQQDTNTKIQVVGNDGVKASGLEDLAIEVKSENVDKNVKVVLEAKATEAGTSIATEVQEIEDLSDEENLNLIDITLTQTVSTTDGAVSNSKAITETGVKIIEVLIPFSTARRYNISVYRYHANVAEEFTDITETFNPYAAREDKTFYVDYEKDVIHIFTTKFSIYGIGFDEDELVRQRRYSSPYYDITLEAAAHGSVTVDQNPAIVGSDVVITVAPEAGFAIGTITVTDASGKTLAITPVVLGETYKFRMPGAKVKVAVSFRDDSMLNPFVDVKETDSFYDAVMWALSEGITQGADATHFLPLGIITRAEMITFLWRAAGSPVINYAIPFKDVDNDAYYADAVRWGVEKGIIKGTSETTFEPDLCATKAEAITVLARFDGVMDEAEGYNNRYNDVTTSDYFKNATLWIQNLDDEEKDGENFNPNEGMKRSKFINVLYKLFKKDEKAEVK